MHVYHSRWHELTADHIETLFKAHLSGVTAFPYNLLPELRRLNVATLEVVEDRTESTIYLIRETGTTYVCPNIRPDDPKASYKINPPPFVISEAGEFSFIERLKEPKFKARYNPETKEIFDIKWEDGEPNQTSLISVLKKAAGFLRERVK